MLGCIHPMSSPMMKRMFGLPCAGAGALGLACACSAMVETRATRRTFRVIDMAFLRGGNISGQSKLLGAEGGSFSVFGICADACNSVQPGLVVLDHGEPLHRS